uniref:Globin domain-containing protein n=1 Tax=Pygocentrus nattereri TaxID=42514 RepID=A0AAR2LY58_PYGNA
MLSARERELLIELWDRLTPAAEHIGSEALLRMFTTFPKTKTYFAHLDLTARSEHLRSIGKRIVEAIAEGTRHIGTAQFTANLSYLSRFHAYQLRIHPTNFKVHLTIMIMLPGLYIIVRETNPAEKNQHSSASIQC